MHDSKAYCIIKAFILPRLTCKIPSSEVSIKSWPHLSGLQLADPHYGQPGHIQLLIGADYYGQIIKPDLIKGDINSLLAQLTIFGWILSGPTSSTDKMRTAIGFHCTKDQDLYELITRFWIQEEIQLSTNITMNPEDDRWNSHYQVTHSRDDMGRYIVRLPCKLLPTSLGDSTNSAFSSLIRLQRKFDSDPTYQHRHSFKNTNY